jgi:CspA family cold shock protein
LKKDKQDSMTQKEYGKVTRLCGDRNYGFIRKDRDGTDIFFHASGVVDDGYSELQERMRVEFSIVQGRRGPEARDVTRVI